MVVFQDFKRKHDLVASVSLSVETVDLLFVDAQTEEIVLDDVAEFRRQGWHPYGAFPRESGHSALSFGAVLTRRPGLPLFDETTAQPVQGAPK